MKTSMAMLALALFGCTSGRGEVDVSATTVATFPSALTSGYAADAPLGGMTTDVSVMLDFRKDLESLSNLGALSGAISKNDVSGTDLGLIHHIKVSFLAEDGKLPVELLSDVDVPAGATDIALPVLLRDSQILDYLREGKVIVHFYVTGDLPRRPLTLTHTFIAHVNVNVAGSVLTL